MLGGSRKRQSDLHEPDQGLTILVNLISHHEGIDFEEETSGGDTRSEEDIHILEGNGNEIPGAHNFGVCISLDVGSEGLQGWIGSKLS